MALQQCINSTPYIHVTIEIQTAGASLIQTAGASLIQTAGASLSNEMPVASRLMGSSRGTVAALRSSSRETVAALRSSSRGTADDAAAEGQQTTQQRDSRRRSRGTADDAAAVRPHRTSCFCKACLAVHLFYVQRSISRATLGTALGDLQPITAEGCIDTLPY